MYKYTERITENITENDSNTNEKYHFSDTDICNSL